MVAANADQAPIRTLTVTIAAGAQEELFGQLRKFADANAFAIRIRPTQPGNEYFLVQMWREDIKVISTNSFDPATFRISFFQNSGEPVPAASVDALITELRRFIGDTPGVGGSTSAGQAETIRPKLKFEIFIRPEEISELRQIVERFARSEGFVLEDILALSREPVKPGHVFLWLERDNRVMRVIVHNYADNTQRILVLFYNLRADPRFDETVEKLRAMIDERWRGQPVPMDDSHRVPTPVTPTLRLELRISPDDGESLRTAFERFVEADEFKITEHKSIIGPSVLPEKGTLPFLALLR